MLARQINAADATSDARSAGDGGNGIDDRVCDLLEIASEVNLPFRRGGDKQTGGAWIQACYAAPARAGLRHGSLGCRGRGHGYAVNLRLSGRDLLVKKAK